MIWIKFEWLDCSPCWLHDAQIAAFSIFSGTDTSLTAITYRRTLMCSRPRRSAWERFDMNAPMKESFLTSSGRRVGPALLDWDAFRSECACFGICRVFVECSPPVNFHPTKSIPLMRIRRYPQPAFPNVRRRQVRTCHHPRTGHHNRHIVPRLGGSCSSRPREGKSFRSKLANPILFHHPTVEDLGVQDRPLVQVLACSINGVIALIIGIRRQRSQVEQRDVSGMRL